MSQKKNQANWKKPFGLAVSLILLASFAFWLENKHKPQQEAKSDLDKKAISLKDVQVQEIKVTAVTAQMKSPLALSFKCIDLTEGLCKVGDQSKWEITSPSQLRADDTNVNSLLSAISNLNSSEVLDLSTDPQEKRDALLKDYKLDSTARSGAAQKIEITYSSLSNKEKNNDKANDKKPAETLVKTLYIGEQHPIGDNFFAVTSNPHKPGDAEKIVDDRVLLIPNYFKSNFEHDLTYWRDKKLFSVNASQIQELRTIGKKSQYVAAKKEGKWTIQYGKSEFPGDIENIDNLLSAVFYLNAKNFAHENKNSTTAQNELRMFKQVFEMNLKVEGNQIPVTFKLFEKNIASSKKAPLESKLYATISNLDPVFEMENTVKDRVEKTIKELRLAKLITSSERFNIKKIIFEGSSIGAKPLILTEEEGKWFNTTNGTKISANHEKVQEFLDKISGNRIRDFLTDEQSLKKKAENTPHYMKVTLGNPDSPDHKTYAFWKVDQNIDMFYAKNLIFNNSESYAVDAAIKESLPWNPNLFDAVTPSAAPSPNGK